MQSSAVQRVGLLHEIDWHWDHRSKSLEGAPAVTVFAPTNEAFNHLPPKLKRFLFSPPGHHVLRKILSYHIVPDFVLHTSEYCSLSSCRIYLNLSLEIGW